MIFDYQKPDRGWCGDRKRGAALGRSSTLGNETEAMCRIRRVPLDGDYDPGGTYWGSPDDLFCVFAVATPDAVAYLRANSIETAKAEFPKAQWAPELEFTEAENKGVVIRHNSVTFFQGMIRSPS